MSMSGSSWRMRIASRPLSADSDHHVVLLQHGGQGEDVPHVVVHDQHLPPGQDACRSGRRSSSCCRCGSGSLASGRCRKNVARSSSRPGSGPGGRCRRPPAAASRRRPVGLAVGVDDHRQPGLHPVGRRGGGQQLVGQVAGAPGPSDDAVGRLLGQRLPAPPAPSATAVTSTSGSASRAADLLPPGRVRLDHQQPPGSAGRCTPCRWSSSPSSTSRLGIGLATNARHPDASAWSRASSVRDHAHRDVPGGQVVLEPLQHPPAVDVRQVDVERDGVRLVLAGQGQGGRPERGDQPLEPLLAGGVEQEPGEPGSFSTISSTRSPGRMSSRSSPTSLTSWPASAPGPRSATGVPSHVAVAAGRHGPAARDGGRAVRDDGPCGRPRRRVGRPAGTAWNVLPRPGVDVSRISPPSSRDSSRLIARPRPVPPYLRLVEPSACWNASKMICCLSAGMPMPVSVTANASTSGGAVQLLVVRAPPAARPARRSASPARGG